MYLFLPFVFRFVHFVRASFLRIEKHLFLWESADETFFFFCTQIYRGREIEKMMNKWYTSCSSCRPKLLLFIHSDRPHFDYAVRTRWLAGGLMQTCLFHSNTFKVTHSFHSFIHHVSSCGCVGVDYNLQTYPTYSTYGAYALRVCVCVRVCVSQHIYRKQSFDFFSN